MQRTVWTFGLIAGHHGRLMMLTMPFEEQLGGSMALAAGYSGMILGFLMVYFGIRTFRNNSQAGVIRFGPAFKLGLLIALIASTGYVLSWEVLYHTAYKGFEVTYSQRATDQARVRERARRRFRRSGQLGVIRHQLPERQLSHPDDRLRCAPVGLVMTLVCAAS